MRSEREGGFLFWSCVCTELLPAALMCFFLLIWTLSALQIQISDVNITTRIRAAVLSLLQICFYWSNCVKLQLNEGFTVRFMSVYQRSLLIETLRKQPEINTNSILNPWRSLWSHLTEADLQSLNLIYLLIKLFVFLKKWYFYIFKIQKSLFILKKCYNQTEREISLLMDKTKQAFGGLFHQLNHFCVVWNQHKNVKSKTKVKNKKNDILAIKK